MLETMVKSQSKSQNINLFAINFYLTQHLTPKTLKGSPQASLFKFPKLVI